MIFENKFKKALDVTKGKNKDKDKLMDENEIKLEKNDLLAMILAGIVVILPAALFILGILFAVIWFFFLR